MILIDPLDPSFQLPDTASQQMDSNPLETLIEVASVALHVDHDAMVQASADLATVADAEPQFSGYYNADGTYHWTSDNTDRDPETGAIVRRY